MPVESRPGQQEQREKSTRQPSKRRPTHEHYRRTSAVIDDRPDGKPIIFKYGRHMSKREKDRAKRMIAYCALVAVAAISLSILVVAAVWVNYIYPNQTIATVSGDGVTGRISRHDVDAMTSYMTYVQAANNQGSTSTTTTDMRPTAFDQLQRQTLTAIEAKKRLGITLSTADVDAQYKKAVTSFGGSSSFNNFLSAAGISGSDYRRLIVAPGELDTKIGAYLTRKDPKTAEEWHYARIQVANSKTATQLLKQIATNKKPETEFTTLAKSKSTDSQTASLGGDLGWERAKDTATDSLLSAGLISFLSDMEKSHTVFKIYHTGSSWYILEFLGHDLKHKLTAAQTQDDQSSAENAWMQPLQNKAMFNPPPGTGY